MAKPVFEERLHQRRDNPSFQVLWRPDRYNELWTAPGYDPEKEYCEGVPIIEFFFRAIRQTYFRKADRIIEVHGLGVWSRSVVNKVFRTKSQTAYNGQDTPVAPVASAGGDDGVALGARGCTEA